MAVMQHNAGNHSRLNIFCAFRDGSLSAPEGGVMTVHPEAAGTEREMESRRYSQTQEHCEETSAPSTDPEGTTTWYFHQSLRCYCASIVL